MINISSLSFSYPDYTTGKKEKILSSLSLSIKENESILILGEPESGKTTLSLLLSSLLTPEEGSITVDGKEREEEKNKLISLVPQNTDSFILMPIVEDEVAFPLENLAEEREEIKKCVERELKNWGLWDKKERNTSILSGGEKRRLSIATALVKKPKYIIYDEAFDDLDSFWREKLKERIKEKKEASIVFHSRYLPLFDNTFDRIYTLSSNTLVSYECRKERVERIVFKNNREKNILEVENLKFSYSNLFQLKVDSFSLHSGSITTLMGLNGSGKTTFSRLLCGLEKMEEGTIKYNKEKVDESFLRRKVGYVFQNPDWQIFLPTVKDEIEFGLKRKKIDKNERETIVKESAALFGLNENKIASLMGYGERKRLQCALYYVLDRPIYILDEIDSALSYNQVQRILELLARKNAAILVITHDSSFACSISDKMYIVEEGRVYEK